MNINTYFGLIEVCKQCIKKTNTIHVKYKKEDDLLTYKITKKTKVSDIKKYIHYDLNELYHNSEGSYLYLENMLLNDNAFLYDLELETDDKFEIYIKSSDSINVNIICNSSGNTQKIKLQKTVPIFYQLYRIDLELTNLKSFRKIKLFFSDNSINETDDIDSLGLNEDSKIFIEEDNKVKNNTINNEYIENIINTICSTESDYVSIYWLYILMSFKGLLALYPEEIEKLIQLLKLKKPSLVKYVIINTLEKCGSAIVYHINLIKDYLQNDDPYIRKGVLHIMDHFGKHSKKYLKIFNEIKNNDEYEELRNKSSELIKKLKYI